MVLKEDLLEVKVASGSTGSFFIDPDWVVMNYEDVSVSREFLESCKNDLESATNDNKKIGLFYRYNHYGRLRMDQQSGIHWPYLHDGLKDIWYCTCGLILNSNVSFESAPGHRYLPDADRVAQAFISGFKSVKFKYFYKAYCQACHAESDWNPHESTLAWVTGHENGKLHDFSFCVGGR